MSKNLRTIIIACAILYGVVFLLDYFKHKSKNPEKLLQEIATEQNKVLPKTINSDIRWDSVAAEPNLTYHNKFTVTNPNAKQIPSGQFEAAFRQSAILPQLCNESKLKGFWDMGGKMKFSLFTEDKSLLQEFNVNSTECKTLAKK